MKFSDWWKTSSAQATEDYYKLRFDENEIGDMRRGVLNDSAKAKFQARVKKYTKMSGALIGGCLALMSLLVMPFACLMIYSFYEHPSAVLAGFGVVFVVFIAAVYSFVALKLFNLSKDIKADLKNGRVNFEQGNLKINVSTTGTDSNLQIVYSINSVEFKVLQDAIGDEINKRFLSPIVSVADSRTTREIYRIYYLPESKLILHFEQINAETRTK